MPIGAKLYESAAADAQPTEGDAKKDDKEKPVEGEVVDKGEQTKDKKD